jgi:hypothetical protein
VFGGSSDSSGLTLNSVELYNWRTGQQCQLPNLTYPIDGQVAVKAQPNLGNGMIRHTNSIINYMTVKVAVVMNGTPAYCGGYNSLQCFKLDKVTRTWIKVSC